MISSRLSPLISTFDKSCEDSSLETLSSSAFSDSSDIISTSGIKDFNVVKKTSIFSFVIGKSGTTSNIPSKKESTSSSSSLFFIKDAKAPVLSESMSSCLIQFIFTPFRSNLQGTYSNGVKNSL